MNIWLKLILITNIRTKFKVFKVFRSLSHFVYLLYLFYVFDSEFLVKKLKKKLKSVKNGGISFQFFILLGRNTNDAIMQNFIQISQKLKIRVQNVFKLVKDTPPPFPVLRTVIVATIGPPLIELNVRYTDLFGLIKKSLLWCMYKYKSVQFHFSNI